VNVAEATLAKQGDLLPCEGLLVISKLAQHAHEEGHRLGWDEARVLEIESNSRYRK
jgi:hypothetical protein